MNKIVLIGFQSFRFSAINSTNSRYFCSFSLKKSNYLKLNCFANILNPRQTKTSFSILLSKIYFQTLRQRINFSTFSPRNQRLNQILKNEIKDKSSKSPKMEEVNEWQQMRQLSLTKKLKFMFTKYWYISIPIHFITSILWFGTSYLIAKRFEIQFL